MACDGCRWWQFEREFQPRSGTGVAFKYGECRRHAPVLRTESAQAREWPHTRGDAWCGDYESDGGAKSCK